MKKIIEKALDMLLTTKSFQDYINGRITRNHLNQIFCIDDISQLSNIYSIQEYHMDDIRHNDVVLDAGANIGAFSLPASTKCKCVYAVEPLYSDIIQKNIWLNHINNISVFPYGIGTDDVSIISHGNRTNPVVTYTLSHFLKQLQNSVTFLKMDIEGYEWFIKPEELEGIHRIEAEIHFTNGKANNGNHNIYDMFRLFEDYDVNYENHGAYAIVHSTRRE